MRFNDKNLKTLTAVVIGMLLMYGVCSWVASLVGNTLGGISALIVAAVTFACAHFSKAGMGNKGWFLVPTLIFTIVPMIAKVYTFLTATTSWIDRIVEITPFLFGFLGPLIIVMFVHYELQRRTSRGY